MLVWKVDPELVQRKDVEEAAETLRSGGLVAFPTETVYGLGANAWEQTAVQKIFKAKGRPSDNPLIVHIGDRSQLPGVVRDPSSLTPAVQACMDAFWPGPLTLVLPASLKLAEAVHPGTDTVGVRMPAHPVAMALLKAAGCPIAAPSANQSGKPSPTTAADVMEDMAGRIEGVVDGGACDVGVESTVLAIGPTEAVIYRPGGVTQEMLQRVLDIPVVLDAHLKDEAEAPKSPGMKYRHYAPNAKVHVWWGDERRVQDAVTTFLGDHNGESVAVMSPEWTFETPLHWTYPAARYAQGLSSQLYSQLRAFDRAGAAHIVVVGTAPTGLGAAVMNRLQKAAEGRVHHL